MDTIRRKQFVRLNDGTVVYVTDIVENDDVLLGDIDDHGGRLVFYRWQVRSILKPEYVS